MLGRAVIQTAAGMPDSLNGRFLVARLARIDPQLPMTETAWASAMRRIAAGRLSAVSENQSHKIGCRSAVSRVRRQSTLC